MIMTAQDDDDYYYCAMRSHRVSEPRLLSVACALVLIDLRIGVLTGKRSSPKKRQLKKALIELKKFSDLKEMEKLQLAT